MLAYSGMVGDVNLYLNDADEPTTGEIEVISSTHINWSDASLQTHVLEPVHSRHSVCNSIVNKIQQQQQQPFASESVFITHVKEEKIVNSVYPLI